MTITIQSIIPVFRIFDIGKAREFYIDFLGFCEDWAYEDKPVYMQVSKGLLRLNLSEHHGDGCPGALIRVEITNLETYHTQLVAKEYDYFHPKINKSHNGMVEMTLRDPFGNTLKFLEKQKD